MSAPAVATRERPILFSGAMVRAILDGRKTQTRRVALPQPPADAADVRPYAGDLDAFTAWDAQRRMMNSARGNVRGTCHWRCPFGQPGDRLWVRESWACCTKAGGHYLYEADGDGIGNCHVAAGRFHTPIFMPRAASRLTLELTGVRVERVQDISALDVFAEGITEDDFARTSGTMRTTAGEETRDDWITESPEDAYRRLWDSLNAKRGYGWDVNPWVWVLEFRRVAP